MGSIAFSENGSIRSCLESVIELVSSDLKNATQDNSVCHTLSALVQIVDEVDGYHENDKIQLKIRAKNVRLVARLGQYIRYKAEEVDTGVICSMTTILPFQSLVTVVTMFESCHSFEDDVVMAKGIMSYLLSLKHDELLRACEDMIDIGDMLHRTTMLFKSGYYSKHYGRGALQTYKIVTECLTLHRKFVHKLLMAPSNELKVLGLEELSNLIINCEKWRTLPLAFVVSGDDDEINGTFLIDGTLLTDGGRLRDVAKSAIKYVKSAEDVSEDEEGDSEDKKNTLDETVLQGDYCLWRINQVKYGYDNNYSKAMIYINKRDSLFEFSRPRNDGWVHGGDWECSVNVEAKGFVLFEGIESSIDHDLIEWLMDKRVFETIANGAKSLEAEYIRVAHKVLRSILYFIGELASRVTENASLLPLSWGYIKSKDAERDGEFIDSIFDHITQLKYKMIRLSTSKLTNASQDGIWRETMTKIDVELHGLLHQLGRNLRQSND